VVEGVRVSAIFEDLEDGRIRISLRSKDPAINVANIAAHFGGGGHAMAAGIRMKGELNATKAAVLEKIKEEMNNAQ
jgi:phosphoesterase RecJ-like protein